VFFVDGFRLFNWLSEGATIGSVRLFEMGSEHSHSPYDDSVANFFVGRNSIIKELGETRFVDWFNHHDGLTRTSRGVW
jgi:hypothetical protein